MDAPICEIAYGTAVVKRSSDSRSSIDRSASTARISAACSVEELVATIERHIAHPNDAPRPFVWTASAAGIVAELKIQDFDGSEQKNSLRSGGIA